MAQRRVTTLILICVISIGVDQFTKYLVVQNLGLASSLNLIGTVVRFTYIRNPNGAFGFSFGPRVPLMPIALLAICILLLVFYRTGSRSAAGLVGLSLILGGAIGNLIDRIRLGEVVDFVDVGVGRFRWPVFNVADSCVTVGVVLLVAGSLFSRTSGAERSIEHQSTT
jgi:signal peptidase II